MPGHKEDALEMPFDPGTEWGPESQRWRGRNGHILTARINGHSFAGYVVPRQKRFYLIVDKEIGAAAGVATGDLVKVALQPRAK